MVVVFINVYVNLVNELMVLVVVCEVWLNDYVVVLYEILLEICEFEWILMIVFNVYL